MEGCGYRDLQTSFDAVGVKIIAVGRAEPATLQSWAEDEGYEYEMWTDDDRSIGIHYGATTASSFFYDRITVLLDAEGNQLLTYDVGLLGIGPHPASVLEDVQAIYGD